MLKIENFDLESGTIYLGCSLVSKRLLDSSPKKIPLTVALARWICHEIY